MADITINQLTNTVPTTACIIPLHKDGSTLSTTLAQLSALPFMPKAWVAFNGQTNFTPIGGETRCQVWNSYNIQKVVKINTGQYYVHFNTPMSQSTYCVTGSNGDVQNVGNERIYIDPSVMYTSYFMVQSYLYNDVLGDNNYIGLAVWSN